jgi:hypothetical protein
MVPARVWPSLAGSAGESEGSGGRDILPAAADGLGELLLLDGQIHGVRVLVDDDR